MSTLLLCDIHIELHSSPLLEGNEARYFTIKKDTVANRAAGVAPPAPTYNYTDLPDSQYDIPPFVGKLSPISM